MLAVSRSTLAMGLGVFLISACAVVLLSQAGYRHAQYIVLISGFVAGAVLPLARGWTDRP
ncbi:MULTISPECIES: hypothetical protein [Methylobacteriaceae]|jgi:hypothetical protein|uniref:Uncharacterized protein n=1 Tax=Methylobacterium gregans TaxID=374424 RepID=A0AA37HN58_9HYPH|nr:hypothetical protein [Methylobacterium gregans]MDQ0522367.1 hypothetical protein [Methylobacterium gregans]GJD78927.1 hypothetical protein NBEOAGPD_2147 [Methylobacterium gregans]GLS55109.1 hypothetical protein GCM10007886_32930 [Methylobacterium gregans]